MLCLLGLRHLENELASTPSAIGAPPASTTSTNPRTKPPFQAAAGLATAVHTATAKRT